MSLVLEMSELLNKSSLDSISIWLFDQTISCSVYVFYYGCISPLSFSEICRKITSIIFYYSKFSKIAALDHFIMLVSLLHATFILMILHTKFYIFDDSAHKFWRMIAILSVWSKQYWYELGGNDDTPTFYSK